MGEDTNIVVNPSELKTNAVSDDFPNGRWMIHHDYKYYDNNLGQSNQTETYKPDLMCNFDKPGKYNIYFDDKLKKEVYVHRLPVADFTIKIANKQLTLTSISYDLDKNEDVGYGRGIASEKWYYKKSTDTAWTEGKLTTFDNTQDYVIKLEVTDMQGATSSITKYVGEGAPVAYFNYGTTVFTKYQKLEVTNTSYDPIENAITDYNWVLKKDGKQIQTFISKLPTTVDFNTADLGPGTYTYTLTIKNSKGVT